MYSIAFKPQALAQFDDWTKTDKKIQTKIITLLEATITNPYKGIGKPEALKHNLKGCYSRRITKEHRLVYQVTANSIIVISCKFHY